MRQVTGKIIGRFHPDKMPDMITEGEKRYWTLTFSFNDILNFVNARTVAESRRNPDSHIDNILTEKDSDYMIASLQEGVANINKILARRMEDEPTFTASSVEFKLTVGENHDDNMSNVLHFRIMDYLQEFAFCKWAGVDASVLEPKLTSIRSALQYRKHGILRRPTNIV